jgi:hypothetical protein
MASPAQSLISQTTLQPSDNRKPSISVAGSSQVIDAIVTNAPFPDMPANITVGQLTAQAGSSGQFNLPGVNIAPVNFSASASANASLAAYQNPSSLTNDLGFTSEDGKQLNVAFPAGGNTRFLVVRWGFDVSGAFSGKMALNPAVNITFGASGGADGLFAFVMAVDKAVHARDAFLNLLNAWCTPGAVADGSSPLPPGSWIITEVTGQLSANLGLEAGYDFNWVKSVSLNDLEGDIGLRISLGLQAALTAQLAGKYYLVLNRDTAVSGIRLRLFRAKTKGWGFALNTGLEVTPSTGSFLPKNLDDFIRAIFGIHDAQLVQFLQAASLQDITNALGAEFLKGLRIDSDVNKAFADLQSLLQKWEDLPNEVTSVIWNAAAKIPDLSAIQKAAQQISQLSDSALRSYLGSLLQDVSFMNNPVCQWLESEAAKTLFDLYESSDFTPLRLAATKLGGILDGSTLQTTLTNLRSKVDNALNLSALETALQSNNLTGVAVWVTQQLAKFLGVDISKLQANLGKINTAITTLRAKSQEIYQATLKALNNTYGFSLDYAYSASDTQSALIDVQFSDTARAALVSAIKGDFRQILGGRIPGVTLNTCTLAHAIQRHEHIETHLPWWTGISDDLATGYAKQTLADSDGGRVQFFEAGATDTVVLQRNTALKRFASCSIGISAAAVSVRKFNVSAVDFGYSLVTSKAKMTRSAFEYDFGPAAQSYFPGRFGDANSDPLHAPFESWVVDWDKFADTVPSLPQGDGVIGNTWVNLQIRSRAKTGTDWVTALLNNTSPPDYMAMSRKMQENIRKYLLVAYGDNPAQFSNIPGKNSFIAAFLVYTALPGLNDFTWDGSTLRLNPKGSIMWDVRDCTLTTAVTEDFVGPALRENLSQISALLSGIPQLKGYAAYYQNAESTILGYVLNGLVQTDPYISLLHNEKTVIGSTKDAFEKLRIVGGKQLQKSLPEFSAALTNLVSQFNAALGSLSLNAPQVMRLFAPLVFKAAVEAMFPRSTLPYDALLDVALLKGTTAADPAQPPSPDQILLRQRITSFS